MSKAREINDCVFIGYRVSAQFTGDFVAGMWKEYILKQVIAIVGRANAGKSVLFNRLVGRRKAIVNDKPGVTRDRQYGDATFDDREFSVIDTGGFEWTDTPQLPPKEVRVQAEKAITDADGVILLVDGREPITDADRAITAVVRKSGKPFVLAVNKIDGPKHEGGFYDYYELGAEHTFAISALHGENVEDVIEKIFEIMPEPDSEESEEAENAEEESVEIKPLDDVLPIAIIGRPNVGKSTLANALLGYERTIVSDMPGTTRDAIDTEFMHQERKILLVDTAGIRRPSKVKESTEYYSVQRALKAVERSRVVIFLLDATDKVAHQDKRIAGYAERQGKCAIIGVNKWDLVADKSSIKKFEDEVYRQFRYLDYAPIVTISAKDGQRIFTLLNKAVEIADAAANQVPTSLFNRFLENFVANNPPPMYLNKRVKIFFGAQKGVSPPRFEIIVNNPKGIQVAYRRFLINSIRKTFGFEGSPIKLMFDVRAQKKRA